MSAQRKEFEAPMYFDPKRVGESLYEVSSDLLRAKDKKVTSKWYTGDDDADFFTWQDASGHFVKAQLTYCGQVFEWNLVSGVRTGVVIEEESKEIGIKASETIQYDAKACLHTVGEAVTLIENLINMEEHSRKKLLENINCNHTIDSMSHEEFWDKYGHGDVKYSKSKTLLGFRILWHHIKSFFRSK